MYKIDFEKPIHIHFIGIGGISMSGLAEILLKEGFTVSGSDNKASALTEQLEKNGAKIFIGQRAANITKDIQLVVYTAAIHPDNAEWKAANDAGIPMLTRAQFLGQLMDNYARSIAVSGTHGKTTTTSMISHILLEAKTDPTISVGGMSGSHRRKYPRGRFRCISDRSLRIHQQFPEFPSEIQHYPEHRRRSYGLLQGYQ